MALLRQGDILLVAIDGFPQAAAPARPVRYNSRLCHILAVARPRATPTFCPRTVESGSTVSLKQILA
jgi:hypothetical protein